MSRFRNRERPKLLRAGANLPGDQSNASAYSYSSLWGNDVWPEWYGLYYNSALRIYSFAVAAVIADAPQKSSWEAGLGCHTMGSGHAGGDLVLPSSLHAGHGPDDHIPRERLESWRKNMFSTTRNHSRLALLGLDRVFAVCPTTYVPTLLTIKQNVRRWAFEALNALYPDIIMSVNLRPATTPYSQRDGTDWSNVQPLGRNWADEWESAGTQLMYDIHDLWLAVRRTHGGDLDKGSNGRTTTAEAAAENVRMPMELEEGPP